jgi:hypothetical protein
MTDTTTKVREHDGAMGLTDRIKSALATLAPEGQTLTVPTNVPRRFNACLRTISFPFTSLRTL